MPDTLYGIVRLVHIVAGVAWVGFGAFEVFFLSAAVAKSSVGKRFAIDFYRWTRFHLAMPIAAIASTVAGLTMYGLAAGPMDWFSTTGNIVLAIGTVAGLLAFGHGITAMGKYSRQFVKLATQIGDTAISTEQTADIEQGYANLEKHARISLVLTIIALLFMASARYL